MFGRVERSSRGDLIAEAALARSKGRKKKALKLYEQALGLPGNQIDIHARMAPLLAETQQTERALSSFSIAALGFRQKGFLQKAESVWMQATQHLPEKVEVWQSLADAKVAQKKNGDARQALFRGSKHFRRKRDRNTAIQLLRHAFSLDPYEYEVTLDLARLLLKRGERDEARYLLDGCAERCQGQRLRVVRGLQLRTEASFKNVWRWLRAALLGR
jgi:thioredoxin-like negative regulator of GroEL